MRECVSEIGREREDREIMRERGGRGGVSEREKTSERHSERDTRARIREREGVEKDEGKN